MGGRRRRIARTDGSGQTKMDERRENAKKIRGEEESWMEKNYARG